MRTLTVEELRSLTAAVNARIAEEYNLFGLDFKAPSLPPAIVRVAREVILADGASRPAPVGRAPRKARRASPETVNGAAIALGTVDDIPRDIAEDDVEPLSGKGAAIRKGPSAETSAETSGPEAAAARPLAQPVADAQTNGTVTEPKPALPSHIAKMALERAALRVRVFAFLREIAMDGVMPSVAEYDSRKPGDLPSAFETMNRLGFMMWSDVARAADLAWKGRGRTAQDRRG